MDSTITEEEIAIALAEREAEIREDKNARRREKRKLDKEQKERNAALAKLGRMSALVLYPLRRDRMVHPEGRFDNAGRWYPTDDEDEKTLPAESVPRPGAGHTRTCRPPAPGDIS